MDYTKWRFWMDIGQMAGTILIGVYVWFVNRKAAQVKRCEASVNRISALENRTADIERGMESKSTEMELKLLQMPQPGDIKELRKDIANLDRTMNNVAGRLEGVNRVADLMNQFLIEQGGKHSG